AAPVRASTGLAHPLISPGRPACERPTAGPAILWSHPSGDWLSFGASPFMTPLPSPRAERGATRCLTQLGSECELFIRTYVGSRLFYEADRGPRPAAQPENRPRRDLVAPVCSLGTSVASPGGHRHPAGAVREPDHAVDGGCAAGRADRAAPRQPWLGRDAVARVFPAAGRDVPRCLRGRRADRLRRGRPGRQPARRRSAHVPPTPPPPLPPPPPPSPPPP